MKTPATHIAFIRRSDTCSTHDLRLTQSHLAYATEAGIPGAPILQADAETPTLEGGRNCIYVLALWRCCW